MSRLAETAEGPGSLFRRIRDGKEVHRLQLAARRPADESIRLAWRPIAQMLLDPLWLERGWRACVTEACREDARRCSAREDPAFGPHFWPFVCPEDRQQIRDRYAKAFPEKAEATRAEASRCLRGEFTYAGEIVRFPGPDEWFRPLDAHGNAWLHLVPASFRWLNVLGRAHWLTDEPVYAQHAVRLLAKWAHMRQDFRSGFWRSTCDVGTRGLALISALAYFGPVLRETPGTTALLIRLACLHGALVERRAESVGWNHVIWSAHDIALLGLALEGLSPRAMRWRERGLGKLAIEVERQLHEDGVNVEGSALYQVYVTKLLGEVVTAYDRAGFPVHRVVRDALQRSAQAVKRLRRPDGRMFLFGDCYRGPDSNLEATLDESAEQAIAMAGLDGAVYRETTDAEALWLLPWLGESGESPRKRTPIESEDPMSPSTAGVMGSSSGLCTISHADSDGRQLSVCIQAMSSLEGVVHAHADALAVQFASDSGPVVTDSGSFVETADPLRAYFRGPEAHSRIIVDDVPRQHLEGVFRMWPGKDCAVEEVGDDGYLSTCRVRDLYSERHGVAWVRDVLVCGCSAVVILDRLTSVHPIHCRRHFHMPPGVVERRADEIIWTGREEWRVALTSPWSMGWEIAEGQMTPPLGWYTENRGEVCAAPTIVERAEPGRDVVLGAVFSRARTLEVRWVEGDWNASTDSSWFGRPPDWRITQGAGDLSGRILEVQFPS